MHGDDEACRLLAQQLKGEGFDASAPIVGKTVGIKQLDCKGNRVGRFTS